MAHQALGPTPSRIVASCDRVTLRCQFTLYRRYCCICMPQRIANMTRLRRTLLASQDSGIRLMAENWRPDTSS